jgi:hypothetical protein
MIPACSVDDLSNEVLLLIFEELPRSFHSNTDLVSCVFVSKRWHALAITILWRTISVDSLLLGRHRSPESECTHYPPCPIMRTPFDGMEDLHPDHLAKAELCRNLCIRLGGDVLLDVQSFVLACKNLQSISMCVLSNASQEFQHAWKEITQHIAKLPTDHLETHLYMEQHLGDSILLDFNNTDPCLLRRLTSLKIHDEEVRLGELTTLLSHSINLKSFRYQFDNCYLRDDWPVNVTPALERQHFWEVVQSLELEILSFPVPWVSPYWEGGSATLPRSLREVSVVVPNFSTFDPSIILQQLDKLRHFIVECDSRIPGPMVIILEDQSVEDMTVVCHDLETLDLGMLASMSLIQTICFQCPSIKHLTLPFTMYAATPPTSKTKSRPIRLPLLRVLEHEHLPAMSKNILEDCAIKFPLLERLVLSKVSDTEGLGFQEYTEQVVQAFLSMRPSPPPSLSAREVRAQNRSLREHATWFYSMVNEDVETGDIYLDMTVARERFRVGAVSEFIASNRNNRVRF